MDKNLVFSFNHVDQQDKIHTYMTSSQIKAAYDSRGSELRTYCYKLADELNTSATKINTLGTNVNSLLTEVDDLDRTVTMLDTGLDALIVRTNNLETLEGEVITAIEQGNLAEYMAGEAIASVGNLENSKFDDAVLNGNELIFKANGVSKNAIILPTTGGTGGTTEGHTHNNKAVLDNITSTDLANYDTAYAHSQTTHAPSNAQPNADITKSEIEAKLTGNITTHTHSYEPVITKNTAFNLKLETTASNIKMNGTQSLGSLSTIPRADHVHPVDTSRAAATHSHTKSQITDLGTIATINDTTASTSSVYSSAKVSELVANAQSGGTIDLSSYATKSDLTSKVDKVEGKSLISDSEITRLASIVNYTHPSTHSPSIIVQDTNNRFVTDAEKTTWNGKSTLALGTSSSTAYRGDYGNTAYTHSQSAHAPSNAEQNVQSDWNITDTTSDGYIKNKPTIPTIDVTKAYVDTEISKKANTSHSHTKSQITDFPTLSTVATSGSYADLSNKPTIPTVDVNKSYVDTEIAKKVNTNLTINSKPLTDNITLDRDDIGKTLVTKSIASSTLTLSTNMYQTVNMVTGTTIALPTVSSYTEIHLLFSTTADLTLTFPTMKWQSTPSIVANKIYEIIFTYPNSAIGWIGGIIQYG